MFPDNPWLSGTFDVSLVSDGLQSGPARQELLQLVSRLLVVRGVHAAGRLHGCRGQMGEEGVIHHASQHTDRHDGSGCLEEIKLICSRFIRATKHVMDDSLSSVA